MTLSRLNRRAFFELNRRQNDDGWGGALDDWQPVAPIWIGIKPLAGGEVYFRDVIEDRTTHLITTRFRRDIRAANRIFYRETFNDLPNTSTFYLLKQDGDRLLLQDDGGIIISEFDFFDNVFNIRRIVNRDRKNRYIDMLCEENVVN